MRRSFSIGRALGDGLGLIARRPLGVFLWGLIMALPTLAGFGMLWPMVQSGVFEPEAVEAAFDWEAMMAVNAWSGLSNLLSLVVTAVIGAAVIRVTLDRRTGAFGGLRLSPAEFYYILVQAVLLIGICLIAAFAIGLFIMVGIAFRGLPDGPRIAIWVALSAVGMALLLWLWARTGLISVASVARRELAFEEGWALTRGRALPLAVMGVIALILSLVIFTLIVVVSALPLIGMGVASSWMDVDWDAVTRLSDVSPGLWFGIACLVLGAVIGSGAMTAVAYAPWASAWRQLTADCVDNLTDPS